MNLTIQRPAFAGRFSRIAASISAAVILTLGACATTPDNNPTLSQARTDYQMADSSAKVKRNAPVELLEARRALDKAEDAFAKNDQESTDHYATIASRRAQIAMERGKQKSAQDEIAEAEAKRDGIIIDARTQEAYQATEEARRAKREARAAMGEAQAAISEAEAATARANALEAKIAELQAAQTQRGLVLTLQGVLFDLNKATLKSGADRTIERIAEFLNEYPDRKVLIEGFTDNTGSAGYNQNLSERRAGSVRSALISQGVPGYRIQTRGLGEAYPVATNSTSAGRQQNRRVEIIISDDANDVAPRS